jgi:protein-ribulosamine 3-kinase
VNAELMAALSAAIAEATGERFSLREAAPASGGSIHASFVVSDGKRRFFVKTGNAAARDNFAAEEDGLARLAATATIRVPSLICRSRDDGEYARRFSFLVLEYLPLAGNSAASLADLGTQIAALHRANRGAAGLQDLRYGLDRDNFIGATVQPNAWCDDWIDFFRERRLRFQFDLAAKNGYERALLDPGSRLLENVAALFSGYRPEPSLLHGDLWSGNAAVLADGTPVIFDPAVYYGDREADIAMTELFGGFGPAFYRAYDAAWPRDSGYAARKTLYNLYHVLNHLNLFGAGYLAQAQRMMAELNAALR